jgi:hypothetical protein
LRVDPSLERSLEPAVLCDKRDSRKRTLTVRSGSFSPPREQTAECPVSASKKPEAAGRERLLLSRCARPPARCGLRALPPRAGLSRWLCWLLLAAVPPNSPSARPVKRSAAVVFGAPCLEDNVRNFCHDCSAHSTPFGHLFHQHPAGSSRPMRPLLPRPLGLNDATRPCGQSLLVSILPNLPLRLGGPGPQTFGRRTPLGRAQPERQRLESLTKSCELRRSQARSCGLLHFALA